MGVTNVLYDWGFEYEDPKHPYKMKGFVNIARRGQGLEFYKSLYDCCTAPGMTNAYMQEGLDAFKSGQVAMQMNFFAFWPGLYKDPTSAARRSGSFCQPGGEEALHAARRPGISVVSYSPNRDAGAGVLKWFAKRMCRRVVGAGRLLLPQGGAQRPGLPQERPLRAGLPHLDGHVKDFWAETVLRAALLGMQKRVHGPSR